MPQFKVKENDNTVQIRGIDINEQLCQKLESALSEILTTDRVHVWESEDLDERPVINIQITEIPESFCC